MIVTKKVKNEFSNMRLDKVASIVFSEYSRTQIKKWIQEGRILLNNELALPKEKVTEDDEIEINPINEQKVSWEPENIDFSVLHKNDNYIIIDKKPNLVMHPGAGCKNGTLANGLVHKFPELKSLPRCGIVHRLDKNTSGVLLIARSEKFRTYFIDQMQLRNVKKKYLAITKGNLIGSIKINSSIGRDRKNRTKMCIRDDGKESLSFVKPLESYGNYSYLEVLIKTGRTHQIRVHLSSKKMPIIGDKTYNSSSAIAKNTPEILTKIIRSFPRQALHAHELSFQIPSSEKFVTYKAPMHEDMSKLLKAIKKHT